jgi:hypothetical protein
MHSTPALRICNVVYEYVYYVLVRFKILHVLHLLLQSDVSQIYSYVYAHATNYGKNVCGTCTCKGEVLISSWM